jgi:hypothetical protein
MNSSGGMTLVVVEVIKGGMALCGVLMKDSPAGASVGGVIDAIFLR